MTILAVDFGSTFTKGVLLADDGTVLGTAATVTTGTQRRGDILDGYRKLRHALEVPDDVAAHACSSAGGGLRLAVVGYERTVTAQAGHRVGLSAGAKVVHVAAGELTTADAVAVRATRPDMVLLVGGTDGGNSDVLLHNAARLAKAAIGGQGDHAVPVIVAGNVDARDEAVALLRSTGRPTVLADNVLPQIGVIAPESARAAIRAAFLRHVIGGKGLSRDPAFAAMVAAATPDVVLRGVEVLATEAGGGDVLVVDIGGATTDVYSCLTPEGEDATLRKDVVAPLWHARTVEGDLGMRWNAEHIVEAAEAEQLVDASSMTETLRAYAVRVHEHPARSPSTTPSAPSTSSWRGWQPSSRCDGTPGRLSRRSRRAPSQTSRRCSGRAACYATPTRRVATGCSVLCWPTTQAAGRCRAPRARGSTRHTCSLRWGWSPTATRRWPAPSRPRSSPDVHRATVGSA